MEKLGGRKFVFGMMLSIMGFFFAYLKYLTAQEWITFEAVIGATYVIGNVGADAVEKLSPTKL